MVLPQFAWIRQRVARRTRNQIKMLAVIRDYTLRKQAYSLTTD